MKEKRKNTWFTSDLHFGHQKCIEYCNRPYRSIEEMDEKLIKNWNRVVQSQDTVIVVGDFFMYYKKAKLKEILGRLNGTKVLVSGNHDLSDSEMFTIGFSHVCRSMTIKIAGETVNVSHYPYQKPKWVYMYYDFMAKLFPKRYFRPRRFADQLKDDGRFLLCGHTHSKNKYLGNRQIHVGVDCRDFTPVAFQKIANEIAQIKLGIYKEKEIKQDNPHD
jgi:calcineurin-like phosphoesterase family protein